MSERSDRIQNFSLSLKRIRDLPEYFERVEPHELIERVFLNPGIPKPSVKNMAEALVYCLEYLEIEYNNIMRILVKKDQQTLMQYRHVIRTDLGAYKEYVEVDPQETLKELLRGIDREGISAFCDFLDKFKPEEPKVELEEGVVLRIYFSLAMDRFAKQSGKGMKVIIKRIYEFMDWIVEELKKYDFNEGLVVDGNKAKSHNNFRTENLESSDLHSTSLDKLYRVYWKMRDEKNEEGKVEKVLYVCNVWGTEHETFNEKFSDYNPDDKSKWVRFEPKES